MENGAITQYAYDPLGCRISKRSAKKSIESVWLGDQLLSERTVFSSTSDPAANVNESVASKTYLFKSNSFEPIAFVQNEGIYYYHLDHLDHLDHLGTPQEITNQQGELVWAVRYKAYGNLAVAFKADVENNLRFAGQYFDEESGLHYNRFRYYDPACGRFINQDPIGLLGGVNNYLYVPNPTGWVDPLGLTAKPGDCPGSAKGRISTLDPNEVRLSQKTVSYNKKDRKTGNRYTYDDLLASMNKNGWQGDPIDVVEMPDGKLTSMDNTRVTAAREANINVQAIVRDFNEPLTDAMKNARGWQEHNTWGEAILARINAQGTEFSAANPYGATKSARVTGRPKL